MRATNRLAHLDDIVADESFQALNDLVAGSRRLGRPVASAIVEFKTLAQAEARKGRKTKLQHFLESYGHAELKQIAKLLLTLYRRFPGREHDVRAVLVEQVMRSRIAARYGEHQLMDNVEFELDDAAGQLLFSSGAKSADVLGCDSEVGDCYDAKVRARLFVAEWIEFLRDGITPHGFAVGLACADSKRVAGAVLEARNVPVDGSRVQLVSIDDWWTIPPMM